MRLLPAFFLCSHSLSAQNFILYTLYPLSAQTPILLLLSPGMDPSQSLRELSLSVAQRSRPVELSLGQGQGPLAERAVDKAMELGHWVLLQNCHLMPTWLPRLQQLLEAAWEAEGAMHVDFRLWLSTEPTRCAARCAAL